MKTSETKNIQSHSRNTMLSAVHLAPYLPYELKCLVTDKGKSKIATSLKETFLPGLFNEWIDGDFDSFGYKKQAEKEYNPNEVMDPWFKSDYAIDRKEAKAERKKAKEELQEYWEKEFKYEDITENDKLIMDPIIEKLIREELNATHPLDIRGNYDENQERIE